MIVRKKCFCCEFLFDKTRDNRNNKYCAQCIKNGKHLRANETLGVCRTDRSRRKVLIKERGYLCESCHNKEWMGKSIPIEIDHIDGNSNNNSSNNLRLLCPNCHAQTPTYKAKNKGNGREFRRVAARVRGEHPAL